MSTSADYFVGVTIGEGSYGKVVHGRHKATGKDVAIKVVEKVTLKKQPHLMKGIWRERTLLSQWRSDCVVPLYASFHDSECLYLVMACSTGGDLTHVIRCGRSDFANWKKAIPSFATQLVSALEFIHSHDTIHADLKPDNILVTDNGRLQLADFGCSVSLHDPKPLQALGTVDYSSPEVLRNASNLTVGADLWSFGCILYAMWEGESPFHAKSDSLAILEIVKHAKDCSCLDDLAATKVWKELISSLLHPDATLRLGVDDFRERATMLRYTSIRKVAALSLADTPLSGCPFQPPKPEWWIEAQTTPMRDGNEGWMSYLL